MADQERRVDALAQSRWDAEFASWLPDFEAGWGADFDTLSTFTPTPHEVVPPELHEWIDWSRQVQVGNGPRIRTT